MPHVPRDKYYLQIQLKFYVSSRSRKRQAWRWRCSGGCLGRLISVFVSERVGADETDRTGRAEVFTADLQMCSDVFRASTLAGLPLRSLAVPAAAWWAVSQTTTTASGVVSLCRRFPSLPRAASFTPPPHGRSWRRPLWRPMSHFDTLTPC